MESPISRRGFGKIQLSPTCFVFYCHPAGDVAREEALVSPIQ